ncbi:hypothetical protein [Pseudobacteriovorax antillogorgiicola]|uniref:DUF4360 domain-containing protein n=1 Tax=Pseudobacteriovorax antillogorgiicola TaxID=1513793 RepID=A0A1Y6B9W6_9BACT|nr:hypothetical protein [Pseudobacteriovorax antillogorgiicola]TCS57471.1 hypothetical protein EDD56_103211 [Pseudobacteriovorax antillogorgiicola]SMF00611.1 hypothetical protein SAMN06296036_103122 [Pseudobacteriovorax antillogorgiicola]
MKLLGTVASLLLASNLMAGVDVRFSGSCADQGDFDAQGADVEYFGLGLDLFGENKAECVITTTIPAKRGFTINVSDFKAEGFAQVEGSGFASMFVNHRFNGQTVRGVRDFTNKTGNLLVAQRAIGVSKCDSKVVLRTKLTTTARNADLFQDSAQSNTVRYKIRYVRCR